VSKPLTLGFAIPRKSEIPIEVTGPLKSQPRTMCIGVSAHRGSESVIRVVDIASGEIAIEKKSRQGKEGQR
jgi:hypothetical protein